MKDLDIAINVVQSGLCFAPLITLFLPKQCGDYKMIHGDWMLTVALMQVSGPHQQSDF